MSRITLSASWANGHDPIAFSLTESGGSLVVPTRVASVIGQRSPLGNFGVASRWTGYVWHCHSIATGWQWQRFQDMAIDLQEQLQDGVDAWINFQDEVNLYPESDRGKPSRSFIAESTITDPDTGRRSSHFTFKAIVSEWVGSPRIQDVINEASNNSWVNLAFTVEERP